MQRSNVGLIGLGLAGKAIARRLIAQGFGVSGHDVSAEACAAAEELGVAIAADAGALASGQPVLLLSLPDSEVVKRLLWEEGLAGSQWRAGHCSPDS
jgi:3-hydroxyisobutyrate dehydrogenase-like beta-hydroxyacid dehydrogenase